MNSIGPLTMGAAFPMGGNYLAPGSFANLSIAQTAQLYYDPNLTNGCNQGSAASPGSSLAGMSACIGTYLQNSNANGSNSLPQTQLNPATMGPTFTNAPLFSIIFDTPEYLVSFVLSSPGQSPDERGNFSSTTFVTANLVGGGTETAEIHLNLGTSKEYVNFVNGAGIVSIDVTNGAIGTARAVDPTNNTANILFSNVAATAVPEPSTMGLIGFGLIGVGYLSRRRKTT